MPDNKNNKPKLKPGEIVGIIIAVVLMLLVASCTLMGTGSSKSSNWDNLTKDENSSITIITAMDSTINIRMQ